MKLYGAIDLHSTNNVTVVINEQDQVVYQKRLPNDLSLIAQQPSFFAWSRLAHYLSMQQPVPIVPAVQSLRSAQNV